MALNHPAGRANALSNSPASAFSPSLSLSLSLSRSRLRPVTSLSLSRNPFVSSLSRGSSHVTNEPAQARITYWSR